MHKEATLSLHLLNGKLHGSYPTQSANLAHKRISDGGNGRVECDRPIDYETDGRTAMIEVARL